MNFNCGIRFRDIVLPGMNIDNVVQAPIPMFALNSADTVELSRTVDSRTHEQCKRPEHIQVYLTGPTNKMGTNQLLPKNAHALLDHSGFSADLATIRSNQASLP